MNNLLSLIHVLLPVAAEASKHGAHMRPKKAICCANNLLSLVHVLLPVAAQASKHGAHHETKESHLLCELDVRTSLNKKKSVSGNNNTGVKKTSESIHFHLRTVIFR